MGKRAEELITNSPQETKDFGRKLAQSLKPGDCLALIGELGAGKTTLIKGIAEGLGIKEEIVSPSFILVREYKYKGKGKVPLSLYHIDAYRIRDPKELSEIGIEEYLLSEGIVAIEWGEKVKRILPPGCIEIHMEILAEERRKITVLNTVTSLKV